MKKELSKTYSPKEFEKRTYDFWLEKGYFHAEPDESKKPYTIVIPPPNITGKLHMGHALNNTLQDVLIRYKRMQGFSALWIPGTDHASIATEAKIVEAMKKEGISKDDIGRDEFLKRAWEWKEEYGGTIVKQLKKLGTSCDWDRERFTLDEGCNKAVNHVFVKLYEKGLIYQGERIVNWCPHCKTSISDAEVEYEEKDGSFWHIKYPFKDGSGFIELATTRPETMLGDTAVAVNPKDERYKDLVGKTLILPIVNKEIPLIADDYVDMEFGTGVVKITPAHDPNDFEVGLRHNLPIITVTNDDGTMNENAGKFNGMDPMECRKAIVKELDELGYLVNIEPHSHNVGTCYRCKSVIEPRVSKQWFVKMKPLAEPAIETVKNGEVRFIPERFDKTYFHWMENIKDWCISRQLWWGHRIPAYYCEDCGEVMVSEEAVHTCSKCGSKNIHQDEDTLDTWFSSALWPFSTLGWPDKTKELEYYYPTSTLVTAYDIIFFWVARMIFSAVEHTGKAPFKDVLIHGLVRDSQGRKMSKSLGNGIDPLEIIDEYGADALRLTLMTGNSPGNDMRYSDEKIKASRNFINKIWNAARFILMNLDSDKDYEKDLSLPKSLEIEDKWILSKLNTLAKEMTDNIDNFELGIAVSKIYDFSWDVLCDWYIELVKSRLSQEGETAENARRVLLYVFRETLKLLHPFIPYVTEEIWQSIPNDCESIMISEFPKFREELCFQKDEEDFQRVMDIIRSVRATRSEMNVPPSKKAELIIDTDYEDIISRCFSFMERLASASSVSFEKGYQNNKAVCVVTDSARVFIPMEQLIDKDKEMARLDKEKKDCQKDIDFLSKKLSNQGFVAKAPANVIEMEKAKLEKARERMKKIEESIANL